LVVSEANASTANGPETTAAQREIDDHGATRRRLSSQSVEVDEIDT